MKINWLLITLAAAAALVVTGCGKEEASEKHEMTHEMTQMGNVKLVRIGDIQTSFEVMDSAAHHKMAMDMKMENMAMDKNATHYVLLSVMDKVKKSAVKDLKVAIELTAPGGKTVTRKTHVMEGMGMYHYAAGCDMKKAGEYSVKAVFSIGDKLYEPATTVSVK